MAIVINPNEVSLNGVRYPLVGQVQPQLISVFAQKQVIGDYSKDSDPVASTWIIDDLRGGILVEVQDSNEPSHRKKFFFGDVRTNFPQCMSLPDLFTSVSNPTVGDTPTITQPSFESTGGWSYSGSDRSSEAAYSGSWAARVQASVTGSVSQALTGYTVNKPYLITCWIHQTSAAGDTVTLTINDGVGSTAVNQTTTTSWAKMYCMRKLDAAASEMTVSASVPVGEFNGNAHIDLVEVSVGTVGDCTQLIEFNGAIYGAFGNVLAKSTGGNFSPVGVFPATITHLVSSVSSQLYIYLGDSQNYWSMTTAEVFTRQASANAKLGVHWDDKLFKINTTGQLAYSTNGTSWANHALLPSEAGTLQKLDLTRDSTGNYIIYALTTTGLWALDYTNTKWVKTEVSLPSNTLAGKASCHWRDAFYLSSGLQVIRYRPGDIATIESMGLDTEGGLPTGYNGAIVDLIKGHNEFFALVDATQVSGTNTSGIYQYDGYGWQFVGSLPSAIAGDKITTGLVSSVSASRLWVVGDVNGTNTIGYYVAQATKQNPISSGLYTFNANGTLYTSWNDMGWANQNKIATKLRIKTSNCTANRTITPSYRVNRATIGNLATGWTAASGAITGNGVTEFSFTGGLSFNNIQFKLVFATNSSSDSPIVEWLSLAYVKQLNPAWAYSFVIDCSKSYNGKTAGQMIDALKTATELTTLPVLSFRNDTGGTESYYCQVREVKAMVETGERKEGFYSVLVVVP